VREVAVRAPRELPAGARIEDKGLSVALHYREHPEVRPAIEEWSRTEAAKLGLRAQEGRMAVELRPPVDRDKGSVVTDEVAGLTCAWYFGDDLSDLRAFEALEALESAGDAFAGVRAAVHNPETGGRLADLADLLLDGPDAVPPLLERIAEAL
jgi:trehalose 6-phosphate phosphatase